MCVSTLIIGMSAPACAADNGGYIVRPAQYPGPGHDEGSTSVPVSFWQLPLRVQLLIGSEYVLGIGAGVIGVLLVVFRVIPVFVVKARHLLDNRNREAIYRYIDENPGCTVNDISRGRDLNVGSVRYHVERLGFASRIMLVRAGKFTRLFRNSGAYSEREIAVLSALNIRTNKAIALLVRDEPGLSNKEIAGKLAIKESMAHLYLAHLLEVDVIRFTRNGQQKLYYLEDDVGGILDKAAGARATRERQATV